MRGIMVNFNKIYSIMEDCKQEYEYELRKRDEIIIDLKRQLEKQGRYIETLKNKDKLGE